MFTMHIIHVHMYMYTFSYVCCIAYHKVYMHVCDRACEDQPCERKLHRVIFSAISSALNVVSHFHKFSEESPLNSTVVTEILLCLYKQFISYDRARTEKIGDFFALTWLIFTGPVTYMNDSGAKF